MQFSKRPVAIAYYRVSTDKQGKSGLGLADQEKCVLAFCESRGLSIEGSFTEVESGKNNARPELAKALAAARRRGGLLVIAKLDRLGRSVHFISGLMESGIPFAAADAPDDQPFILHVKASFAEEEARKISTRTKAAMAVLKSRGVQFGTLANLTPEGGKKGAEANRTLAAVENYAISQRVLALRAKGGTVRSIATELGLSNMKVHRLLERAK